VTNPLTTTGAYVTVLRRAHNRWAVAYRVGSVIVHHPLANGSEADAPCGCRARRRREQQAQDRLGVR